MLCDQAGAVVIDKQIAKPRAEQVIGKEVSKLVLVCLGMDSNHLKNKVN